MLLRALHHQVVRRVKAVDAWDFDQEEPTFGHRTILWEHEGDFYCARWLERIFNPTPENERDLFQTATLVPRDYYLGDLPPLGAATRAASTALSNPNVYLKKIEPYMFDPERSGTEQDHPLAVTTMHEMRVCEVLSQSPHPNLCRYLGYMPTPDGNHVLGLCFERYERNLSSAVEAKVVFDPVAVIDGLRRGLQHLHSLRYAHNDINPTNIMLDNNALPVIIDFDSCRRLGEELEKAGTPDWDHDRDVSLPENDLDGLEKVQKWLDQNYITV
ncbi:Protein kinase domain-containing protein [Mycena sanguinolenta]|uniref:Protein kinase domain-containing protein n=1 Tax=Mycena sanguinolenta TaxID=230812 RepID=A0A8H6X8H2_9AGAR|nr:Protein kinase domain-containing protein [Mycena sanguinolenta]